MAVYDDGMANVFTYLIAVLSTFYLIARAILLALAFASLRSLHPDAYQTVHWTTFIPHI